jgi:hypothetical protein
MAARTVAWSGIDGRKAHEITELETVVKAHCARLRHGMSTQRHVLVVGLVGRCPPAQEILGRCLHLLRPFIGIVVLDFMVVPSHEARGRGMQCLQVRIGAVERVAVAVAGKIDGGWTVVLAHDI